MVGAWDYVAACNPPCDSKCTTRVVAKCAKCSRIIYHVEDYMYRDDRLLRFMCMTCAKRGGYIW